MPSWCGTQLKKNTGTTLPLLPLSYSHVTPYYVTSAVETESLNNLRIYHETNMSKLKFVFIY
jgi:hypothetical protein